MIFSLLRSLKESIMMSPNRTRKLLLSLFSILILLACQIPGGTSFAPPTAVASATDAPTLTPTATATLLPTETPTPTPAARARRVVILSIDGLRPDAIVPAPMQHLIVLMQHGAYSLSAQTTYPSVTLPSHASMLTGMCPSKHGVNWNDYLPERGYAKGPSLFDLAHAAGLRTYMFVTKKKLMQVTEPFIRDN